MERVILSKDGFRKLQEELERLEKTERPKIIEAIATARGFGDLKENAEYHAAKEKQKLIESRIQELKIKLASAKVIDNTGLDNDVVRFGAKLEVENLNTGDKLKFTIVGDDEADFAMGLLSMNSPVGKGLIGHKVGEVVDIKAPAGILKYKILSIYYE